MVLELEIHLIRISCGMLLENGKRPDDLYLLYVSPKMTLLDVKMKICRTFKIENIESTQLWMKEELINDEVLISLVE